VTNGRGGCGIARGSSFEGEDRSERERVKWGGRDIATAAGGGERRKKEKGEGEEESEWRG
jgi:hypothetical protein